MINGIEIIAKMDNNFASILSPEALDFIAHLHRKFNSDRKILLEKRKLVQNDIDNGKLPSFLNETAHIRNSDWHVAALPDDLMDRRVEITGPVNRKMVINALNSGAKVFMADFEDSNSPKWENNIEGQINLKDAVRRTISLQTDEKKYELNKDNLAVLFVRPRGWHMVDKNILIDNEPISAGIMDFGLFFYHNAQFLIENNSGPYFYLPKIESYLEARLWNDIFIEAQQILNIPNGTIKATVLIETILASFQMHEILWELKEHSAGLNCGRWDYIFSYIKKFRNFEKFVTPDRTQITMTSPFMKAYSELLIQTCHKRNVHAMGGMAAQIPIKNNEEANNIAFAKVQADKEREVNNGHDGTWVAHPGLVKVAKDIFDKKMPNPNQIENKRNDVDIHADDLLEIPKGEITEDGLRMNINIGILYIESWLMGNGAAALYNLMEDAATAEISRTQVWQWIKHKAIMNNGKEISFDFCQNLIPQELIKIEKYVGIERFKNGKFDEAVQLFTQLINTENYEEFLTTKAYNLI
jgi:malate synthase